MLNLLPWRNEKLKKERRWLLVFCSCVTFITIMVSCIVKKAYENKIQQKIATSKLYSMKINTELKSVQQLNDMLADKIYAKNTIQNFNQLFNILNVIVKTLPLNCYLTCLIWDHKGLLLEGVLLSPMKTVFLKYVKHLQQYLPYNIKVLSMSANYQTLSYKLFVETILSKAHV